MERHLMLVSLRLCKACANAGFLNTMDLDEKPACASTRQQLRLLPPGSPRKRKASIADGYSLLSFRGFPLRIFSAFPIFALAFRFVISCRRASRSDPSSRVILLALCVNGNLNSSGAKGNLQQQTLA